jgi:LysM repeat protein
MGRILWPRKAFFGASAAGAATVAVLAIPAASPAGVPHVVRPGETLWTIAYANNLTTRALAAVNRLSPDAHVIIGQTIRVPTVSEAAAALAARPSTHMTASAPGAGIYTVRPGDSLGAIAARTHTTVRQLAAINGLNPARPLLIGKVIRLATAAGGSSMASAAQVGTYTVRPGDTLSGVAARVGMSMRQLAALNGIDPARPLLIGKLLRLSGASPAPASAPTPAAGDPPPYPTNERVSAGDIAAVATRNGVPAPLAAAIAWQESGFNNAVVSGVGARGVMQIMPATWAWVQQYLAGRALNPRLAIDNVASGVLFLGYLLRQTGGDQGLTAAGYYQGLRSVRRSGMYTSTRQYVNNVLALRSRFGG